MAKKNGQNNPKIRKNGQKKSENFAKQAKKYLALV
jgi:hypothetical protein